MVLDTRRLELMPLTAEQLHLWLEDLPELEESLGCSFQGDLTEGAFAKVVQGQLSAMEQDPENWQYYTFWAICRREDRVVLGELVVKGPPDELGQVEIGYGISERFRNQGYTTEAMGALCQWLLVRPEVKAVVAGTTADNLPSVRVLEKCGMERSDWAEGEIWYRKDWQDALDL